MDDAAAMRTRRAAKVGHRKSRNGCSKCKTRRVKCDEVRPVCGNCDRLALACSWTAEEGTASHVQQAIPKTAISTTTTPTPPTATHGYAAFSAHTPARAPLSPPTALSLSNLSCLSSLSPSSLSPLPSHSTLSTLSASGPSSPEARFSALLRLWSPQDGDADVFAVPAAVADEYPLPETRARRLLELRLMQHFIFQISKPFPGAGPSAAWQDLWARKMPNMALEHDNLLYALLTLAATHLLSEEEERGTDTAETAAHGDDRKSPFEADGASLFSLRQAYLIAAMREQRRMVDELTLANADAVSLASLVMLINAFAMLRERPMAPYTPPVDWLRLGRGSGAVIWLSVEALLTSGESARSAMYTIAMAPPQFGFDESYFDAANRADFASLLSPALPSTDDLDDPATRDAYDKTLAYVGSVHRALGRGEPLYVLARRVQGFTMVVPPRFVDFVAERRPRALVILAYFFAAVVQLRGVWWLGAGQGDAPDCIARRELRGIRSVLPDTWRGPMVWPLDAAGL